MKTEDIIEGINKHIEEQRKSLGINTKGHIVILRTVTSNPSFKIYKTFKAELWFIKDKKKHLILDTSITDKVINGQEESAIKELNILLMHKICNLILSEDYKLIIKGEYEYISK